MIKTLDPKNNLNSDVSSLRQQLVEKQKLIDTLEVRGEGDGRGGKLLRGRQRPSLGGQVSLTKLNATMVEIEFKNLDSFPQCSLLTPCRPKTKQKITAAKDKIFTV